MVEGGKGGEVENKVGGRPRGKEFFFSRLNWAPARHVTRVVTELGRVAAELPLAGEPLRGFVVELSRIIAIRPPVKLLKLDQRPPQDLCFVVHPITNHGDTTRSQCAHSAAAHTQSTHHLSNTIYNYPLGAPPPDFGAALNIYC